MILLLNVFHAECCFSLKNGVVDVSTVGLSSPRYGVDQFKIVKVTLVVRDINGLPIKGAQIKAFSEDWGFRIPKFQFDETDEYGRVTLYLPVGNWSFFAWGGWDFINRNPGQGYFVALRNLIINSDVSLTLQPDSYISILFLGLDGKPLNGEVRILDSDHVPMLPAPVAGRADDTGRVYMKVRSGTLYDILFSWQSSTQAYIFLLEKVESGADVTVKPSRSSLARITFMVFDKYNMPWNAIFFVNYNRFSVGEHTGLNPVSIHVNGKLDLYATPTLITISPWIVSGPWHYVFIVQDYNLKAGEDYEVKIGGPLSIKVWVQKEQTQIWIDICDSFGNKMDRFWNDGIPTRIPIILTRGGMKIFEGALKSFYDYLGVTYDPANSPDYTIDLDLGPYGRYTLTGTLLSNSTLLPTKIIRTQHLDVEVPDVGGQVEKRFNIMAQIMEEMYQQMSSALDVNLTHRTLVRFQINIIAGIAGPNFVGMAIGFPLDSSYVTIPSTFILVASHELGHVFQLSPPLSPPGVCIQRWFCEPYATLIGNIAIEKLFGERLGLYDRGSHDHFYYYLRTGKIEDFIENMQFALYYIRRNYGLSAFKRFNKIWTEQTQKINVMQNSGLSINETLVAAISLACGDDLSWLFKFIGLQIREEMASWGYLMLSDCKSPTSTFNLSGLVGGDGWFTTSVTVTLSAEDDLSGVESILYSFDGVQWKKYTAPFVISEEGQLTIYFKAVDRAGNVEDVRTITVKIDKTPPITTATYDGAWRNTDFTIPLTASDRTSGVKDTYYRVNFGPIRAVSSDGFPLITVEGPNNTLEYWSIDAAGNEESRKILSGIKLDKTAPMVREVKRQPTGDIETGQPVKVLVDALDTLSGVKTVILSYSVDDGYTWIDNVMVYNASSGLYEGAVPSQGANTVVKLRIIVYDYAGNYIIEDNEGQYFTYKVTPKRSLTMIILVFTIMIVAISTVLCRRILRKNRFVFKSSEK